MFQAVIVANLLLGVFGVGDLAYWIKQAAEGKSKVECPLICKNIYGTGRWGSGWKSGGAKCTCGGSGNAEVTITCTSQSPFSGCTGSQTGGSAKQPAAVQQQDPTKLSSFIAQCATAANGRYAQRNGEVTSQKVHSWNGGHGDAQCSDLAMGCIRNANKQGFNVDNGKRGHVSGMCGSWAWSHDVVAFADAKAGDIAQFSSWHEGKKYSSHSTGCKHTAVIVKDFDPTTGALEMLDQNPSPVSKTVYHPRSSDGWKPTGKLMVYRLKSVLLDGLPAPATGAGPAPTPVSAPAPVATCKDHHDDLVAAAKAAGEDGLTGCADAKDYCQDSEYGSTVRAHCPVTCGTCSSRLYANDYSEYVKELRTEGEVKELGPDAEYSEYVKELRTEGEAKDSSNMSALMLGAFATTAMIAGMVGFGAWRLLQTRARRAGDLALIPTEDQEGQEVELTDSDGIE